MAANIPGYEEVEEPELLDGGKEGMVNELTMEAPAAATTA